MTQPRVLIVESGETYTIPAGTTEEYLKTEVNGTLDVQGTLVTTDNTGGLDLTIDTLEFIRTNWPAQATEFGIDDWNDPILRNDAERLLYPQGQQLDYNDAPRRGNAVTVGEPSKTQEPIGTEYDADVIVEVDVSCETVVRGASEVQTSTDWRRFVSAIQRAILTERSYPITDPNCRFDYRWLEIDNENPLPGTEETRDTFGTEWTTRWYGFERLP